MKPIHTRTLSLLLAALAACSDGDHETAEPAEPPIEQQAPVASAAPSASTVPAVAPTAAALPGPALSHDELRRLVTTLSEPDAEFFSDNFVSNETSYLQVAELLPRSVQPGGVYIGVGPEQNFSYIAQSRPAYAFVLDLRRDNMLLHLLYKAMFDEAESRAHFLTLLTAQPYERSGDPGPAGSIADVIRHAEKLAPEAMKSKTRPLGKGFEEIHARLVERIGSYGFELDDADRRALRRNHAAFARRGIDIRFELKEESFRRYPSLRELLAQADPTGKQSGFLADEASFRFVQRMQRENRIVPLVGNFAGDRALPELAKYLAGKQLTVRSFYVSNVEQYLLADGVWWKWRRNIAALPIDEQSVFIRCYLDQGQRHPAQLDGHRSATTLQRIATFNARKGPYGSMLALSSHDTLE